MLNPYAHAPPHTHTHVLVEQLAGQGKKSGKWSTKYICFGHYCSCPAFTYSVLKGDPRETPFMVRSSSL